jgi:hypothetical protein
LALIAVNASQAWITILYYAMLVIISRRKDIQKHTHTHIFQHNKFETRYWHVVAFVSCAFIVSCSALGLIVVKWSDVTSLVFALLPTIVCPFSWMVLTSFLSAVDTANLEELKEVYLFRFYNKK